MEVKRTQKQRSAATREALIAAARPLFAEHGYAAVSTDQIARAAGVTRGALYHQFDGKEELFAAVFEQVEAEIVARMTRGLATAQPMAQPTDAAAMLADDIDAWLAACAEPDVRRIALIEAPAALGWARWREIGQRYGVGLVEAALQMMIDAGQVAPQPTRPLAHVVVGALEEAGLYAARAEDREAATAQVRASLLALLTGLLS